MSDEWLLAAEHWFNIHTELTERFDPKIADYYSDDAYLQNTVIYEDGTPGLAAFPG